MGKADIERIQRFAEKISESLWRKHGVGRAAAMVGAGFSMNAIPAGGCNQRMLSWKNLADKMREELALEESYQPNATDLAELYEAEYGRQKLEQFLEKNLPDESMEPGKLHEMLLELPWTDIFTTNYDTLLERTAEKISLYQYQPVLSQEDIPEVPPPRIIKLHGTFRKKRPLVFTSTDYQEYPVKSAAFVNVVQEAIMENTFCLFGFSGDDPNFRKWMSWVQQNLHGYCTNIYLCGVLYLSDGQRRLLEKLGIIPIDLAPLIDETVTNPHFVALQKFLQMLKDNKPKNIIDDFVDKVKNKSLYDLPQYDPHWLVLPRDVQRELQRKVYTPEVNIESLIDKSKTEDTKKKLYDLIYAYSLCETILTEDECSFLTKWVLDHKQVQDLQWCRIALFLQEQANYKNNETQFADWTTILKKVVENNPELKVEWLYQQCLWAEKNWQLHHLHGLLQEWPDEEVIPYWQIRKAHFLSFLGEFQNAYKAVEGALQALHRAIHRNPEDNFLISQEVWALYFQQMLYDTYQMISSVKYNKNDNYAQSRWAECRQEGNDPRVYLNLINERLTQDLPDIYSETIGYDINTVELQWSFSSRLNFITYPQLYYFLAKIGIPLQVGITSLFNKNVIEKYINSIAANTSPLEITQFLLLTENIKVLKWYFSRLRVATFTNEEAQSLIQLGLYVLTELINYSYCSQIKWQQMTRLRLIAEVLSRLCFRMSEQQKNDFQGLLQNWEKAADNGDLRECPSQVIKNRLQISREGLAYNNTERNKLAPHEAKKRIQEGAFITLEKYDKKTSFSSEMEKEVCDYISLCRTYICDPFNSRRKQNFVVWNKTNAKQLAKKFYIYLEKALGSASFNWHREFHFTGAMSVFKWDILSVLNIRDTNKVILKTQKIFSKYNRNCLQILPFLLKDSKEKESLLPDITVKLIQGFWSGDKETVQDANHAIETWSIAWHEKIISIPCPEKLWQELLRKVESHSGAAILGSIMTLSEIIQYVPEQLNKDDFEWLMYGMEVLFVDTELQKKLLDIDVDSIPVTNDVKVGDWPSYQSLSARLAETLYKWAKKHKNIVMPDILLKWQRRCKESFLPEINCYFKDT